MAEQNKAYNAGLATRNLFSTPSMQAQLERGKRRGVEAAFPGLSIVRHAVPVATDFLRGIVGGPGAASAAAPVPAKQAAAKPAASGRSSGQNSAFSPTTSKAKNPAFSELASMLAAANGGQISLRQLSALSDIAYKTSPRETVKSPSFKDIVGGELLARSQEMLMAEQAKADELSKVDPKAGAAYGQAAVSKYMGQLQQIMGADPLEQAYAAQIAAAQSEE